MAGKYCQNPKEIPTGEHFVIINFSSIYIEGDQRSRDCPGHGYPGHSESTFRYLAFLTKEEWEEEIQRRMKAGEKDFSAMKVTPATIVTQFVVKTTF